ncbi:MAG: hypothetical protein ABSC06_38320 [Rhodopila sp.]
MIHRFINQNGDNLATGGGCAKVSPLGLPPTPDGPIVIGMFVVTEADAVAIRSTFEQEGELSAAIELRRRFPGIIDNTRARECARSIAGWTPLPAPPAKVVQLRPRKAR